MGIAIDEDVMVDGRHTWHLQTDFILKKVDGNWEFINSKVTTY